MLMLHINKICWKIRDIKISNTALILTTLIKVYVHKAPWHKGKSHWCFDPLLWTFRRLLTKHKSFSDRFCQCCLSLLMPQRKLIIVLELFIIANWLMLTMIVLGLVYFNGLCHLLFTNNWLLTQWVLLVPVKYKIFSLETNRWLFPWTAGATCCHSNGSCLGILRPR